MKANAIPPQPDETYFPSARTKSVPSDVDSGVLPDSEENLMANS